MAANITIKKVLHEFDHSLEPNNNSPFILSQEQSRKENKTGSQEGTRHQGLQKLPPQGRKCENRRIL